MKVVIAYQTVADGDAVGHDVVEEFKALKEAGIDAYIYAENCDSAASKLVSKDSINFLNKKDTILIYHHAIYWKEGGRLLENAACKKVIKYHNVTPEHFFLPYSLEIFEMCMMGRRQNREIADINADMILSDSGFSAKDFLNIGFPENKVRILAPFNKIDYIENIKADSRIVDRLSDGKFNVFFLGRLSPHKGHKSILYTAYYYKLLFGGNIRFIIAGGLDSNLDGYYNELKEITRSLKIDNIVEFKGRVSFPELKSYYLASRAFLLLSEHEGFCIPALESQYFKLPLIAYAASAVKETIGENQLVYDMLDYEILASSIHTLCNDIESKRYLADEGYKNFLKYEKVKLIDKFLSYLKELE